MVKQTIIELMDHQRADILAKHEFIIREGKERLLSQFDEDGICQRSNAAGQRFLEQNTGNYHPDDGDVAHEDAHETLIEYYQLSQRMWKDTRLSIIAMMYHNWEKEFRGVLSKHFAKVTSGEYVGNTVWQANLDELFKFMRDAGTNFRTMDFFDNLERCRLVTNVYKHGNGGAFEQIKTRFPELLGEARQTIGDGFEETWVYDHHEQLNITDEHMDAFLEAIVAFWKAFPSEITGIIYQGIKPDSFKLLATLFDFSERRGNDGSKK